MMNIKTTILIVHILLLLSNLSKCKQPQQSNDDQTHSKQSDRLKIQIKLKSNENFDNPMPSSRDESKENIFQQKSFQSYEEPESENEESMQSNNHNFENINWNNPIPVIREKKSSIKQKEKTTRLQNKAIRNTRYDFGEEDFDLPVTIKQNRPGWRATPFDGDFDGKGFDFDSDGNTGPIEYMDVNPLGDSQIESPRLISGNKTNHKQFRWIVALLHKRVFFCSGTIINDDTILTTAHCLIKFMDKPKSITAIVGCDDISRAKPHERFQGRKIYIHDRYRRTTPPSYDYGLLKLSKKIEFDGNNHKVDSFCLPTKKDLDNVDFGRCKVVGWGSDRGSLLKTNIKVTNMVLFHYDACMWNARFHINMEDTRYYPESVLICAQGSGGKHCFGDIGSPFFCPFRGELNRRSYQLVGITSFNKVSCSDSIVYFSRVSYASKWIERIAESN